MDQHILLLELKSVSYNIIALVLEPICKIGSSEVLNHLNSIKTVFDMS